MEREFAIEDHPALAEMLETVALGEEVFITKNGRPIGRLSKMNALTGSDTARAAAEWIKNFPKVDLGDSVVDLIRAGRKY